MFRKRLLLQVVHFKHFLISLFGADSSKLQRENLVRDSFGLHKIIIIVTSVGKVCFKLYYNTTNFFYLMYCELFVSGIWYRQY